jgi:hypothetical protein
VGFGRKARKLTAAPIAADWRFTHGNA